MARSTYIGMELDQPQWPQEGDKMVFLGKNGYQGQRDEAMKHFTIGTAYTVADCEVGTSDHRVYFEEVPGSWNGVMFERVQTEENRQDS